jgi:hypothetical protein
MASILERFEEDLHIYNAFVKDNIDKILSKEVHPLAFQLNFLYEKLVQINKDIKKIDKIARVYDLEIEMPKYQVDVDLNKKIEMTML